MPIKYTKEILEAAVKDSTSLAGVMRAMGIRSYSGGHSNHIRTRLAAFGIDTSHFTGLASGTGKVPKTKKTPDEIFGLGSTKRVKSHLLRRALLESGVGHACGICGSGPTWQGKRLVLTVDHINGDWSDNRKENLRFLCPNCHSQTETFGYHGPRDAIGIADHLSNG